MSASHYYNVTCAAGEWATSDTFSMIASKLRKGFPDDLDMAFHGSHIHNFSG